MFSTIDPTRPLADDSGSFSEKLGEYTHLRHAAAILIRACRPAGPDAFTLTARWPAHVGPGPYDPRLMAQTIRQSGLLVAHAEYGVPTGHQTLLNSLNITAEPGFHAGEAADFEVDVAVTRTGRRAASLAMEFRIRRDGATVCLADAEFGWVSPAAYRRVRGRHSTVGWGEWSLPEPVAPELVDRAADDDVLLGACADSARHRWQLRNDVSNTVLFDHPVDHVPGLVLLEAAQQAACAAAGPAPVELTDIAINYARYVEFDEPCSIEARRLTTLLPNWYAVAVTGRQGGEVAFEARLRGLRPQA
ncbi:ScbA/BarX family gamma-butyrolactone biosynthesis protein [Streptomyces sp. NPDC049687]|uniref:ScbA/BarX family gamma-butyrolactone biosynthesis protein n=1 Tax=Streptomyces sp. NPDC049687 TaxID=3365596 RepID=UPI0037BB3858